MTERGGCHREVGDPTAVGVQITCHDYDPRGREEEAGVHPVKNFLEDVELAIGGEVHVGVVVGHARNGEVRNERMPRRVGAVAGDVQVRGSIKQGGTSTSNFRPRLDGVVEGVHRLVD